MGVPHRLNGAMLELIIAAFGLDPARMVRVVGDIGNVASASIPVSLDRDPAGSGRAGT